MSLLDQLEQQARERRQREQKESNQVTEQSEFYKTHTAPAMRNTFEYLKKLSQHLGFLDHEQAVNYHIPHYGDVSAKIDAEFTVALSTEKGRRSEIKVVATGHIDKSASPETTLNLQQADVVDQFVRDYSLHGDKRLVKASGGETVGATYRIHGKILLQGTIRARFDEEHIEMEFVNYGGLNQHRRRADPRNVNDDFLDKLGKFLIGEDLSLFSETLPSGVRSQIQQTIRKDHEAKKLEMLENEIADLEDEEKRSSTLSGRLSQRLSALSRKLKGEG
ncbi:MAG: hypothetical protein AB8B96_20020 [Lysobacterales bacterium]